MIRLLLLVVPLAVLASCTKENPDYCKNFPGTMGCPGVPMNGGGCSSDGDCKMAGFPACETTINQGTCEPCTSSNRSACPGDKPHCDHNQCTACVDDSDCAGNGVCLPTGGCADQSNIIHASATRGVITQCGTPDVPCTLAVALLNVALPKNIIKLDDPAPAVYSQAGGFVVLKDVTIDARNAILQRPDAGGPILLINMANPPRTVTLLGGTIQSATGIVGNGIFCNNAMTSLVVDDTTIVTTDSAIQSTDCALNLTRLQVHDSPARAIEVKNGSITLVRSSVYSNHGGGLHIDGSKFVVVSNAFMSNGDANSTHPAIEIQAPSDNSNRLDFNTIAFNSAQDMTTAGVSCTSMNFIGRNNIIWMNTSTPQVSGNCKYKYSDIGPDMVPPGSDAGNNTSGDPKLAGPTDPHIASDSAAHRMGDSTTPLEDVALKDIDGQPRMTPIDIGADQYYPPGKPRHRGCPMFCRLILPALVITAACTYPPLPDLGGGSNGGVCSSNASCKNASFPVCDLGIGSGECVQCTSADNHACGGTTPACVNDKCNACTQHAQCQSHACLPDGSCADAGQVAFVRPTGSGTACTNTAPCTTINDGLKAKSIVKVEGAVTDSIPTTIDGRGVTILADPGSTLTRSMPGVILEVKNDPADVRVYDLEITGGTGQKTDAAVSLSGSAAGSNPKLTLTRVKIAENQGIAISATSGTLAVS